MSFSSSAQIAAEEIQREIKREQAKAFEPETKEVLRRLFDYVENIRKSAELGWY